MAENTPNADLYVVDTKDTKITTLEGLAGNASKIDTLLHEHTTQLEEKAKQLDVANSLATKVDKVTGKGLSANDYDSTEKAEVAKVKNKADTTYVDTKVAAVASGSPKGTYATLSALQSAKPTGDTNVYLVTNDGNWYYWNGSAWTAGGIYQSAGIAVGSVGNEHLLDEAVSFEKIKGYQFDNMFDKSTITLNKYVSNTGVITDTTVLSLSDFIHVSSGQTYTVAKGYTSQGGIYDKNKNWIAKINGVSTGETNIWSFTIPTNGAYVRLNMATGLIDSWMMVPGTVYPDSYKPNGATIAWLNLDYKINQAIENANATKWLGKTIVTFGDSITWYDGNAYNANTTEAGVTVKGYQSYMRNELGATVINQGVSGNTTPQINTRIKSYNYTGVDSVTILAGTNDFRDKATESIGSVQPIGSAFDNTTFIGAYQEAIEHILTVNPEIKIYLFTPIKAWTDVNGLMPETYPNAVLELGELYSLSVCDLYHGSGISDLTKGVYIVDSNAVTFDFHPSTKGYERMANIILPFLENH